MINAEVTAEKKQPMPQFSVRSSKPTRAHKDQGRVQIFFMLLEKFLVVLFGHLVVALVEPSPMIFLSRNPIRPRATRGPQRQYCRVQKRNTCPVVVEDSVARSDSLLVSPQELFCDSKVRDGSVVQWGFGLDRILPST